MRVMVAGASGVVGRALIPKLVAAGHDVIGMSSSASKAPLTVSMGARAVWADALDREAVLKVVELARPEVIVEQLTSLSARIDTRHLDRDLAATNALRVKGTDHLIEAATKTGVRRFVAQSFAGWTYARTGSAAKTEQDSLDPNPPAGFSDALEAIRHLEKAVTHTANLEGLALRYGFFYGPVETTGAWAQSSTRCAGGAFPLLAMAPVSGLSFTLMTSHRQPSLLWTAGSRASTTSWTMNQLLYRFGSRNSPASPVASRRTTYRDGLPVS